MMRSPRGVVLYASLPSAPRRTHSLAGRSAAIAETANAITATTHVIRMAAHSIGRLIKSAADVTPLFPLASHGCATPPYRSDPRVARAGARPAPDPAQWSTQMLRRADRLDA